MTEKNITPVVSLDGMLAIQRWISAVERFDQDGDYSVFAPLLEIDGVPPDKVRCLKEAAYFERVFNLSDAQRKLQTFLPVLDSPLTGVSHLFQDQLKKQLAWAKGGDLLEHQRRLARFYLKTGDYMRATIFGLEALITRKCQKLAYDVNDFQKGRNPASEALETDVREEYGQLQRNAFEMLRNLRNALAHGNPAKHEYYNKIITNAGRLSHELRQAMDTMDI